MSWKASKGGYLGVVVVLLLVAASSALTEELANEWHPNRFAATPVVAEDGSPLPPPTSVRFTQDFGFLKKPKKEHVVVTKATAARRHGKKGIHKDRSTTNSDGMSVDLSKIHRECPAAKCKKKTKCPMVDGVCCGGDSGVCCPHGSTCLTTSPPTCIHDAENDIFRCAEEKCHPDYKCPHSGVVTCCHGGRSCCKQGFRCMAGFPPKCIKLVTKAEFQREARRQKNAAARFHLKKREARGKRFTRDLKSKMKRHAAIHKAKAKMHHKEMKRRKKAAGKMSRLFQKIRKRFGPSKRKKARQRRKRRKKRKQRKRQQRRKRKRQKRRRKERKRRQQKRKNRKKRKRKKRNKNKRKRKRKQKRRHHGKKRKRRRGRRGRKNRHHKGRRR